MIGQSSKEAIRGRGEWKLLSFGGEGSLLAVLVLGFELEINIVFFLLMSGLETWFCS